MQKLSILRWENSAIARILFFLPRDELRIRFQEIRMIMNTFLTRLDTPTWLKKWKIVIWYVFLQKFGDFLVHKFQDCFNFEFRKVDSYGNDTSRHTPILLYAEIKMFLLLSPLLITLQGKFLKAPIPNFFSIRIKRKTKYWLMSKKKHAVFFSC